MKLHEVMGYMGRHYIYLGEADVCRDKAEVNLYFDVTEPTNPIILVTTNGAYHYFKVEAEYEADLFPESNKSLALNRYKLFLAAKSSYLSWEAESLSHLIKIQTV